MLAVRRICRSAVMAAAAFCFAGPVLAAQVGTAVVNGRMVILDADGTWKYQDAAATAQNDCATVKDIQVCLKQLGWREVPKQGDFQVMYAYGDKFYFGVIAEPYGTSAGVSNEGLQGAIISNAAAGGETTADKIPVIATEVDVKGHKGLRSITYGVTISKMPFVFHNVFKVYNDKSVQFVFWALGKDMPADFPAAYGAALDAIKMD